VADLRASDLDLGPSPRVRLHGQGDQWRTCPLSADTARHLQRLLAQGSPAKDAPVFASRPGRPLTRFGLYKIVRRHARRIEAHPPPGRHISPHVFRHYPGSRTIPGGVRMIPSMAGFRGARPA
jgi:integrase